MDRGGTRSRNPRGRGRGRSRGRYNYSRGGSSRNGSRNSRHSVSSSRQGGLSKAIQHLTTLVTDMRSRIDRLERADNGRSPTGYRIDVGARSTTTAPHDKTDRHDGRTSDALTIQLFKYIQIYHHSRNWMHCPRAIARDVDRLVDNINPPNATNTVRKAMADAADRFKDDISDIVRQHLADRLDSHCQEIITHTRTDVTEAEAAAKRFIRTRQQFNRISDATINEALSDLGTKLDGRPELSTVEESSPISPTPPPRPNHSVRCERGVKRGLTSPQTTATAKKAIHSDDMDTILVQAEIHATTSADLGVSALPERPIRRSASTSDMTDNIATQWERIPVGTETLLVIDSNGRMFHNLDVPQKSATICIPGLSIRRCCNMLQNWEAKLRGIPNTVLAVGINNRYDLDHGANIASLKGLQQWAVKAQHRVIFTNVPDSVQMKRDDREGIRRVNNYARDVFGCEFPPRRSVSVLLARCITTRCALACGS